MPAVVAAKAAPKHAEAKSARAGQRVKEGLFLNGLGNFVPVLMLGDGPLIGFTVDSGDAGITVGSKGFLLIPTTCTITEVTVLSTRPTSQGIMVFAKLATDKDAVSELGTLA